MVSFSLTPPTRVVIRYLLESGQATDALGMLVAVSPTHCTVETKRGAETVPIAAIIAAKEVPPPPAPRPRRPPPPA
jgi:hypothetical protein